MDPSQNLAHYLDETVNSRIPILVTRKARKGNVVIMAEEELAGWHETVHLLSSPRNADRLLQSVRDAKHSSLQERILPQPDQNKAL
ncbi:type II toxin-antitoxin system Phd/YefM family antitoxin [Acetobacter syzygii]|nr:type II toxin-antitoxin system Phd/YefM family antitoxin [Acetobacter syzygii]